MLDLEHQDFEKLFGGVWDDDTPFSYICIEEDRHSGPHKWTPDSEVLLTFAPGRTEARDA